MTDLISRADADAAIVACKGNGATRQACRDAIASLPAVMVGVKQLRDAFDAGSDNGWDQARADPIYGSQPMTNEEAFCAFLAALEPVAAPTAKVPEELIQGLREMQAYPDPMLRKRIQAVIASLEPVAAPDPAAIREAAAVVEREIEQAKQLMPMVVPILRGVHRSILALIQKGAAE